MTEDNETPIADGIYFNMPENQYHALDRLGSTGLKQLLVSPLQFYTENYDPDYVKNETSFLSMGKAYHKRILEGFEAFSNSYVRALSKEDHPNALYFI